MYFSKFLFKTFEDCLLTICGHTNKLFMVPNRTVFIVWRIYASYDKYCCIKHAFNFCMPVLSWPPKRHTLYVSITLILSYPVSLHCFSFLWRTCFGAVNHLFQFVTTPMTNVDPALRILRSIALAFLFCSIQILEKVKLYGKSLLLILSRTISDKEQIYCI